MRNHHMFVFLLSLIFAAILPGAALANSFSGQATVVQATVLGFQPITLADTGPLPPEGGSKEATLLEESVPGLLSVQVLHAATVAMGDASRSEASVASVNLTVGGNTISASFLMARAAAFCDQGQGHASASGSSELAVLAINGQTIVVSGEPNQTIPLPGGGQVIINEQSQNVQGNKADITVNALHVMIPGIADVIIASAHADITCTGKTCPLDKDFVTGGGRINTASGKSTFAVAGGIKNGYWGHLSYIDHGTGMKVKGTGVTAYTVTGTTSRQIKGNCEIDGVGGTYTVDVNDAGEPGRDDTFYIQLSNGYTAGTKLDGGNIQLHTCK